MEYAYEVGQQTADATAYNDEMVEYDDGIPYGHVLDEAGRLLKDRSEIVDEDNDPDIYTDTN